MDKPASKLFVGSHNGILTQECMTLESITRRVRTLGEALGIDHLSAHDCRHYWTTAAFRGGNDIKTIQDAGGWTSPYMPLRYAQSQKIANKGLKLG
jgi:integrase